MRVPIVAFVCMLLSSYAPAHAANWKTEKKGPQVTTEKCSISSDFEFLCLEVHCDGQETVGLYGLLTGEVLEGKFELQVDEKRFPVEGTEYSLANAASRTKITGDTSAILEALRNGNMLFVNYPDLRLDPDFARISLRGSGKAISRVEAACVPKKATQGAETEILRDASAGAKVESPNIIKNRGEIIALKGLNASKDCAFAESSGKVAEVELTQDKLNVNGFWFQDSYGEIYINVDAVPKSAEQELVRGALRNLLREGNRLEIGVHGCGAAAKIEKLVSVRLIEAVPVFDSETAPALSAKGTPLDILDTEFNPDSLNARGVALNRSGDEVEGYNLIKQAADEGDMRALANLGMLLKEGVGIPRNIKAANAAFEKAANAGDPFGVLGWGLSHQEGLGVPQSSANAYKIWEPMFDSVAAPELKFWAAQNMASDKEMTAQESLAFSYKLCSEAAAQGQRPALFYCPSYATYSADWTRHLNAIEQAVTQKPWTEGLNLEKVYVPQLFSDNDEKLRQLIGFLAPLLDKELGIDLRSHIENLGFRLENE